MNKLTQFLSSYRYAVAYIALMLLLNSSLALAHYRQVPNLGRWNYLWYIGTLSNSVSAMIMFIQMRRYRGNRLVEYYAMLLLALCVETWCGLVANMTPPRCVSGSIIYDLTFACFYWSGRWSLSYAAWLLVLFQFGIINGYPKTKERV